MKIKHLCVFGMLFLASQTVSAEMLDAQSSFPDNRAVQDSEYYQLNDQSVPLSFSLGENKNLLVKFSHDTELGNITSAQYTQAFNEDFAFKVFN